MSYDKLFSIKSTEIDLSINYYFDRIQLKKDLSNGYFENYPPYIDELTDVSYISFKPDYKFNNYIALDCSDVAINNIGNIDISLNMCTYLKFIFNREVNINNIQFKNDTIGDVSFILWRRIPILENKYTDELSRTMSYGIIGSTTPVNKQNIVNLPGVISYDFVFQLIPPQPIPRYICYDTYATNNIFYIDPSNLNITGLNSGIGDTSFILWYTDNRNDCSSIYINPDTFQDKFTRDPSNVEVFRTDDGVVLRTISEDISVTVDGIATKTYDLSATYSYTTDSSNISIEELNLLLKDLSGDLINNTQFTENIIKVNSAYPNFTLDFMENNDTSNISIRSDSKLLTYLGIDSDISYSAITNFTFKPQNQPKTLIYYANSPDSLNINAYLPNDYLTYNYYSNIDIYEKRPITDGSYNDISNSGPKNFNPFIKDDLNDVILKHQGSNKEIIKKTNEGVIVDLSRILINTVYPNTLKFTTADPSNLTIYSASGNIASIEVDDIIFTRTPPLILTTYQLIL